MAPWKKQGIYPHSLLKLFPSQCENDDLSQCSCSSWASAVKESMNFHLSPVVCTKNNAMPQSFKCSMSTIQGLANGRKFRSSDKQGFLGQWKVKNNWSTSNSNLPPSVQRFHEEDEDAAGCDTIISSQMCNQTTGATIDTSVQNSTIKKAW